jgi:TolB-like protein/DNA-binding winged helix-turn-helix (wHTH) protein/Flp pilus assembly protein TadD
LLSPTQSSPVFRFGIFEVDPRSRELLRKGVRVRLQDKPFQLLLVLLERPGEVVTREEIRKRLWSADTFVEFDDNLNAGVKKLRIALGDSAEHPRFLETVPKVGYRFIAPVTTTVERDPEDANALRRRATDLKTLPEPPESPRPGVVKSRYRLPFRTALIPGIALAAIILVAWWIQHRPSTSSAPNIRSIAVLPLDNLSGDPQQQYFADGMTDELITELAKVNSLSVISRTSAMQYKRTTKALPVIARELHVDAVVEGSVVRAGNRVRISVQLINARDDRHLWAESYEREVGDLVELQNEVAEAITNQIRVELTATDRLRFTKPRPVVPEAHEAYLRGLYAWNERTSDSIKASIEYFGDAIRKDPGYALAYSGLADAYDVASDYDLLSPRESYSKAKAMAVKALELDPNLAEAHTTLADLMAAYEWNWAGAEAEFKRALALNPGYATAHHWYAQYLTARGRHPEALAEIRRAMELDPRSPSINSYAGSALYMARQYDRSLEQLKKVSELEPNYPAAHYFLGFTYEKQGRLSEAAEEFQKAVTASGGDPSYLAGLAHAYALSRNTYQARAICKKLQNRARREYVSSYDIGLIYLGLKEHKQALDWLERAYQEGDPNMNFLSVEPALDELRSHPRFERLLTRVGLAP